MSDLSMTCSCLTAEIPKTIGDMSDDRHLFLPFSPALAQATALEQLREPGQRPRRHRVRTAFAKLRAAATARLKPGSTAVLPLLPSIKEQLENGEVSLP